ncbi:MAG TPA: Spy/CpxP family protein refolding chaperone [Terriglobales bacterium]|nr:Spy/CpxP family protein refolding chaperone [Terriglobales bacterium]
MKYLVTAIVAAMISLPLSAQTPAPPSAGEMAHHQVKTLTALLNLTSVQQEQANEIYANAAKAEQTWLEAERKAREALRAAAKNNDASTIDHVSAALGQSMARSTAIRAKADAAFYQILTPEQQSKLSDLESERLAPFDLPGGPPGPPGMGFR